MQDEGDDNNLGYLGYHTASANGNYTTTWTVSKSWTFLAEILLTFVLSKCCTEQKISLAGMNGNVKCIH